MTVNYAPSKFLGIRVLIQEVYGRQGKRLQNDSKTCMREDVLIEQEIFS